MLDARNVHVTSNSGGGGEIDNSGFPNKAGPTILGRSQQLSDDNVACRRAGITTAQDIDRSVEAKTGPPFRVFAGEVNRHFIAA